jgi:primary-amine oxidase
LRRTFGWKLILFYTYIEISFALRLSLATASSSAMAFSQLPHPLSPLRIGESHYAAHIVRSMHSQSIIDFRTISLEEPPKAELQPFLELENNGLLLPNTPRPSRVARVTYDVIGSDKLAKYYETLVDIRKGNVISNEVVEKPAHAALTL